MTPPRICRRCTHLCVSEPMSLLTLASPDGEHQARICQDCDMLVRQWFFRGDETHHVPSVPAMKGVVR